MKNIALLLFALVCYTSPLCSQDFWEQLDFPDTVYIRCMTTNEMGDIFVGVGDDNQTGGVYRSNDAGISWELALNMGGFGVLSLEINSEGIIYAGTNKANHNLWVSYNNGNDWQEMALPYAYNLTEIFCQGPDTIYVSLYAANGALLARSTNGGVDWEELFTTTGHPGELITAIKTSSTGIIYISMICFFQDMGGVFRSTDNGLNWEYVGLLNHQINGMAINSNDDIFTSDWYTMNDNEIPGIYALYKGSTAFELKSYISSGCDIVIDSEDHIYVAANESVLESDDNGETFHYINDPLSQYLQILQLDDSGYLYGAIHSKLVRSIYPTITSIDANDQIDLSHMINISPNPSTDFINLNLFPGLANLQSITIGIYDQCGRQFFNRTMNIMDSRIRIDISYLKPGIYFISFLYDNTLLNSKFIKN